MKNTSLSMVLGLIFLFQFPLQAQTKIQNVIILIPDGCSEAILTASRWYQGNQALNVDGIICGLVKTHSVDGKITDSAPASTAYACGEKSKSGYVGVDSAKKPLWSVLELSKQKGKSTGTVFTCQFPHATPADFVCHYENRDAYGILSKQFVSNSPDVVFGGGYKYIKDNDLENTIKDTSKFTLIQDYGQFKNFHPLNLSKRVWGMFNNWQNSNKFMSFDCDRDTNKEPSLSEMTQKAIEILSKNENGFFLMVEGSQVDWAAHANDPKAAVMDFLAFDKAVGVCLEYAKSKKNTVVIVCPDHGNGGFSIGNTHSNGFYDELNIKDSVIAPLSKAKHSAGWVVDKLFGNMMLEKDPASAISELIDFIQKNYFVKLSDVEGKKTMNTLVFGKNNPAKKDSCSNEIKGFLSEKLSWEAFIGWTTHGHTGEDVILGIYHPENERLIGIIDNTDVAKYIAKQLMLGNLPIRK